MFTGIVEEIGTITDVRPTGDGLCLRIYAPASARELNVDNSVAVNGVCLTVVSRNVDEFDVIVVEETIKKTTFGSCAVGDHVNLELAMKLMERLDGHIVLGHVDAVGIITYMKGLSSSSMFTIELPEQFKEYIIPVGSIAVDGVSLTIARIENRAIEISVIPHTMENTIFKFYDTGDHVNIEYDVIGKYIERMVFLNNGQFSKRTFFTEEHLRELGY